MHAPIGRGSGTIALASAHTSCLRQIVKEQNPTDAAGRPGSITPVSRALQARYRAMGFGKAGARIISLERPDTSPVQKKIRGSLDPRPLLTTWCREVTVPRVFAAGVR